MKKYTYKNEATGETLTFEMHHPDKTEMTQWGYDLVKTEDVDDDTFIKQVKQLLL